MNLWQTIQWLHEEAGDEITPVLEMRYQILASASQSDGGPWWNDDQFNEALALRDELIDLTGEIP